jgi:hypothetical protein
MLFNFVANCNLENKSWSTPLDVSLLLNLIRCKNPPLFITFTPFSPSFISCSKKYWSSLVHNLAFQLCNVTFEKSHKKFIIVPYTCQESFTSFLLVLGSNVDSWILDFHNQGQISLLCQPLSQILKRYLFWDSIWHYWISFNNLEIVICLVLVIYVFPWWKLRSHFPLDFFLLFHHCVTMKTTSQITNLSSNFSSCYNESS